MPILPDTQKKLLEIFGERIAFHRIERMLYSSDVDTLPRLIKRFVINNPDAVVQPVSAEELMALLDLCLEYNIPLVPRGSGTSWFGGCVPTKGGIVVDFYRMNKIIEIDKDKQVVVVQPGTVWNNLEAELQTHGRALRLYPSSAISSTVGGWIANGGGVGIGSYEYSRIKDNILEIELVLPEEIIKVTGEALDLVYGMCGTTGLISQVVLKVRNREEDIPVLAAFPELDNLQGALKDIKSRKLALWHVSYKDQMHSRLTRNAVEEQAQRAPIPEIITDPKLPDDKLLAMFVYPASRESKVKGELLDIVNAHHGELLSQELAQFEWDERFYPLRMKAVGPSIVASEVTVPTQNIVKLINNIKKQLMSTNVAFEGILINDGNETLVMQYELDDERRSGFILTMPRKLIPLVAGKKLSSQPYGIGMYLTDYAEIMFGKDTLLRAYEFKKRIDSDFIINPGKVFPTHLDKYSPVKRLALLVKLTRRLTRLIQLIDRLFGGVLLRKGFDNKTMIDKISFGKNTSWDTLTCAQCGYCRSECPEFNAIGWESASPRGKFHFLKEYLKGSIKLDKRMAELFYVCTTCQQCNVVCQVRTRIEDDWSLAVRPAILAQGFKPPMVTLKQVNNILLTHNSFATPQDDRKAWTTSDLKYEEEGQVGYFAGCQVSFNYNLRNLPINAFRIMNKAGIEPAYLGLEEWCCGGAMFYVGCTDEVTEKIIHNVNEFNRRGIKTIITSCAGCFVNLSHFYPIWARRLKLKYDISVLHITQVVDQLIKEGRIVPRLPIDLNVTYHDPCHIGRAGGIYQPPRDILHSIPDLKLIEMTRNREHAACCGRHVMHYPRLGNTVNNSRIAEAVQTGTSAIVSGCPTCENNLRTGIAAIEAKLEVIDIIDLVAESIELPRLAVSKLGKLLCSVR